MFSLHKQLAADTITLGSLPLSLALLMNNSALPWLILVPRRDNIREWHELSQDDQLQLHKESMLVGEALMHYFQGDKLNTAALGNLVPQLHLHHVLRFTSDPVWPHPVWGKLAAKPYAEDELSSMVAKLTSVLNDLDLPFVAA